MSAFMEESGKEQRNSRLSTIAALQPQAGSPYPRASPFSSAKIKHQKSKLVSS